MACRLCKRMLEEEKLLKEQNKPLGDLLTKGDIRKVRKDLIEKKKSIGDSFFTAPLILLLDVYLRHLEEVYDPMGKANIRSICRDKEIRRKIR